MPLLNACPLPLSPCVMLVDDHPIVRMGTAAAMQAYAQQKALSVHLLQAATLQEAMDLFAEKAPDLVVLDLHLPDSHGLSGLTTFMRTHPQARITIMTAESSPALATQASAMGAIGFIKKDGNVEKMLEVLFSLLQASPNMPNAPTEHDSNAHASNLGNQARTMRTASGAHHTLTPRQAEIVDWMLLGKSNKEIAKLVNLSEGTVKNHVSQLFTIAGVHSRGQFISFLR